MDPGHGTVIVAEDAAFGDMGERGWERADTLARSPQLPVWNCSA